MTVKANIYVGIEIKTNNWTAVTQPVLTVDRKSS